MPGRSDVHATRTRLDATFARVAALPIEDMEVRSDFARYLCVLVSGFVETAVSNLATEYCRRCSAPTVGNYVQGQLARLRNIKSDRLLQLMGSFDPSWRPELEEYIEGSRKDALDSVVNLRNKIAHGESVGVTYSVIKGYYGRVGEIIDFIEHQFD